MKKLFSSIFMSLFLFSVSQGATGSEEKGAPQAQVSSKFWFEENNIQPIKGVPAEFKGDKHRYFCDEIVPESCRGTIRMYGEGAGFEIWHPDSSCTHFIYTSEYAFDTMFHKSPKGNLVIHDDEGVRIIIGWESGVLLHDDIHEEGYEEKVFGFFKFSELMGKRKGYIDIGTCWISPEFLQVLSRVYNFKSKTNA